MLAQVSELVETKVVFEEVAALVEGGGGVGKLLFKAVFKAIVNGKEEPVPFRELLFVHFLDEPHGGFVLDGEHTCSPV